MRAQTCGYLPRVLGVLGALWVSPAFGGDETNEPPRAQHEAWHFRDGLPGPVRAFAETPDQRVWAGAAAGIARFDGMRWSLVAPQLGFDRVGGVVAFTMDAAGVLWIVPNRGEPVCWRTGQMSECLPPVHRISDDIVIVDIEAAPNGAVWFATEDLVYGYHRGELSWPSSFPKELLGKIRGLHLGPDGRLWIAAARGLFSRDAAGAIKPYQTSAGGTPPAISDLGGARDGAVLAVGKGYLLRIHQGAERIATSADGIPDVELTAVLEDRRGDVWATSQRGLVRWRPGQSPSVKVFSGRTSGLPADDLANLYEDNHGGLWVATRASGIVRFWDRPNSLGAGAWLRALATILLLAGVAALVLRVRAARTKT